MFFDAEEGFGSLVVDLYNFFAVTNMRNGRQQRVYGQFSSQINFP
jgi:hypothetical protein